MSERDQDFEDARRGFIAALDPGRIEAPDGPWSGTRTPTTSSRRMPEVMELPRASTASGIVTAITPLSHNVKRSTSAPWAGSTATPAPSGSTRRWSAATLRGGDRWGRCDPRPRQWAGPASR